jgi:hypothetical protein
MTVTKIPLSYSPTSLGISAVVLLIGLLTLLVPSNVLAVPKGPGGQSCKSTGTTSVNGTQDGKAVKCTADYCKYDECETSGPNIGKCYEKTHYSNVRNCKAAARNQLPQNKITPKQMAPLMQGQTKQPRRYAPRFQGGAIMRRGIESEQPVELSPDETTTITLDQAVHFIGTDGSDAVADPGDYSVEAAEEWLRLIPGTERRDALLIESQAGTHDVKIEIPIVISTSGTEPDELDIHVVQFLNPDGTSLIATGTYSGIQSRGLRDRARQAAARARARAEGARRAAAAKAQQVKDAARTAALRAKQAAENATTRAGQALKATITKLEEARIEVSNPRIPPTEISVGSEITFKDASGWVRKVCPWVGGQLNPAHEWGCKSHIDLENGRIQVKADFYSGPRLRSARRAEAWVEMYKDFTVPTQAGPGQEQTKIATFNVPIEYHGKAMSTYPMIAQGHYKILLMLDEVSYDAGPAHKVFHMETRVLEENTVKANIKMVKGIPLPIPDVDLTTMKNPVYFSAPIIPGRIYRLTLRVEVDAIHVPVNLAPSSYGMGAAVNFMDKAMIINEQQRVDGYIKWGTVKLRINP